MDGTRGRCWWTDMFLRQGECGPVEWQGGSIYRTPSRQAFRNWPNNASLGWCIVPCTVARLTMGLLGWEQPCVYLSWAASVSPANQSKWQTGVGGTGRGEQPSGERMSPQGGLGGWPAHGPVTSLVPKRTPSTEHEMADARRHHTILRFTSQAGRRSLAVSVQACLVVIKYIQTAFGAIGKDVVSFEARGLASAELREGIGYYRAGVGAVVLNSDARPCPKDVCRVYRRRVHVSS